MKWVKMIATACLPLALSSCFLSPGAFTSNLDLRRDGSFTFAYKGEIIVSAPDDMIPGSSAIEPWNDDMAYCSDPQEAADASIKGASTEDRAELAVDGSKDANDVAAEAAKAGMEAAKVEMQVGSRNCTKKELAEQKKDHEESQKMRVENKKRESAEFASIFGFAPGDDAANKKVAARLMKQPGWKNA